MSMSRFVLILKTCLRRRPILTNSLIYGSLFIGAEFSQQYFSNKVIYETPKPIDTEVLKRYAFYGTLIQGPLLTIWYRWLDKKYVGTTLRVVGKKVLIDQFFMTPQLYAIFYISMSIMEQKSDIFEELLQKFTKTFATSCLFWLPMQSLNFFLIPSTFRVVFVGCSSFIWVNILCWIKRQAPIIVEENNLE